MNILANVAAVSRVSREIDVKGRLPSRPFMAAAPYASAQTRSYYDGRGSFAGSSVTHGNQTSAYDRNGSFAGTAIRNSNGTTSFYNGRGTFVGSSVRTGPRR